MKIFIRTTRDDGSSFNNINSQLTNESKKTIFRWIKEEVYGGRYPSDAGYDFAQFVWEQVERDGKNTLFYFYDKWSHFSGRTYDTMIRAVREYEYEWETDIETLVLMFAHTLIDSAIETQKQVAKFERVENEEV